MSTASRHTASSILLLTTWLSSASPLHAAPPAPVAPDHAAKMARGQELFAQQVRPLLVQNCLKCHGGDKVRSGLDLSTREALLKGGDKGQAIVAGDSKNSRLYRFAAHLDEPHMPPRSPRLRGEQLTHLAAWIDVGAPYDVPLVQRAASAAKQPMIVTDEDRRFWSFQPLRRPQVPRVKNTRWGRTPIDAFILARLEENGLGANAPVERHKLIRRVYFDVIGLPPSPQEVAAFTADPSPHALEKLVDRLLASPHHGERWARHWLDLARFAESHGFEHDSDRPSAFHYRDFIIKAFNRNVPYDAFVKWQIAGDELDPDNPLALAATGFLAAGVHSTQITANQVEKERYDELDDVLRTIGTSMLGLTIGCARCHDHKYDPIPTRDYYRLLSTFTTTVRTELDADPAAAQQIRAKFDAELATLTNAVKQYETGSLNQRLDDWLASRTATVQPSPLAQAGKPFPENIQQIVKVFDAGPKAKLSAEQRQTLLKWFRERDAEWLRLSKAVADKQKAGPAIPKILICSEGLPALRLHSQGADFLNETHFLRRGDPNQKDGVATQSFLQVLMPRADAEKRWQAPAPAGSRLSYRRRALANWITDVDQGAGHLLARVMANRLWQHYFGRGLVSTPSDFGQQGSRPTHSALLDWLAAELVASNWDLKHLHRLILTSSVYQQSTAYDKARATLDPENILLGRRMPRRLEAEIIRDNLLAVGGSLDPRQFGPGTLDPNQKRRSIYFFVKRSQLVPSLVIFDAPDGLQGIEQRQTTTIAPQALLLMNNQFVRSCAQGFARRAAAANSSVEAAVESCYLLAFARRAGAAELTEALAFLREQEASYHAAGRDNAHQMALTDFCQVLFGLNEFIYLD